MIGLYEINDGRSNFVCSDLLTNKSLNLTTGYIGDQCKNSLVFLDADVDFADEVCWVDVKL